MQSVCLVVPCYNEARRLPVERIEAYLLARPRLRICFVDDGSRDATRDVLEQVRSRRPGQTIVLATEANGGKANAVRHGVLHVLTNTDAAIVGYWDADLATPLVELDRLLDGWTDAPERLAALGSRVKRLGTRIVRRPIRHVLGRLFATCASLVLDLAVYDTQCGAKVFRRDAAAVGFQDPFISNWLFDVEILARLRNHYGGSAVTDHVLEVPLSAWADIEGSSVSAAAFVKAPLDLWRIARTYNSRRS